MMDCSLMDSSYSIYKFKKTNQYNQNVIIVAVINRNGQLCFVLTLSPGLYMYASLNKRIFDPRHNYNKSYFNII